MLKRWFTLLLVALLPILGMAQNGTVYPIDLSVMMTPPYGTCLKEYVGSDRIVIQALLKDMSKTSEQFVIQLKVTDNRNRVVFQTWFGDYKFNPGQTFTYPMGPNSGASEKNILDDMFKNASVKLRNECFDEGAYTFTFQAFERASYPARKIALSMPFTYPVFLQGNIAQPLQIYPYDNDVICNHAYEYVLDAENNVKKFATQLNGIAYQWQSANPTGMRIGYHLQVVDLGDIEERTKGQIESAAQSAFRNGSFCPVNEIVYTPFYNHNITAGGYNENHAYAWRVRTVTGEELDKAPSYTKENMPSITDNNSPVRVFYFCGAPGIEKDTFKLLIDDRKFNKDLDKVEMDTVKTTGQSANAFWKDSDLKEKYCGVNVEIRKKGQEKWTPFFVEKSDETDAEGKAVDNSHNFENLSYNTRYEVRAQYVDCSGSSCQNRPEGCLYAPYSDVLEFMIPSPIDTAVCGDDLPKLTVCGEGTSVPKILSGDTIIANGAKVVVDEVSYPNASDSSIISGKGHLSMPIVKNIQLKMEFSEIQINCAKELVKGKVKSIWDEQTCAMINLDELTGQGSTGGKDNAPSEASTEEYSEEKAKNSPSGTLLVDEQGNVKFKLKDGNVENIGKSITLSSNEYQSKNYLAENSHYIEFYSTDKVNNAFDNDSAGWYRKMSHYDFFDAPNNKVILPWLANNPGKLKNIKAREVKKKETMASFDSVMFVIPSDAGFIQLKAEKEIVSRGGKNDTVYDLNIPGWADVNHSTPIFAIAKKSDTSSFFDAGKMMVANYAERTHKLNIVSLVGELDNSYKTEAEKALNSIYGKLGVTYEVNLSVFEDETIKDLLSDGLSIGADAESRWKSETSEMKAIRRIYAEKNTIDKKAAYLFVVNHPEEEEYRKSVEGDMPRSQSVGYIFKDNLKGGLGRLIAHEVGHGVYKFQHTFDYDGLAAFKEKTDNLMDYNSSDPVFLAQYQWRVMQDSVMFVWSVLQDDEDGMKNGKIKAVVTECAGMALAKTFIANVEDCIFDKIIESVGSLFEDKEEADQTTEEVDSRKVVWGSVFRAIPGFLYDFAGNLASGDDCVKEKVGDANAKDLASAWSIVSLIKDIVECYYNAESEAQLNSCLCEQFAGFALDEIVSFVSSFIEEIMKNEDELKNHERIEKIKNLKEKYKKWVEKKGKKGTVIDFEVETIASYVGDKMKNLLGTLCDKAYSTNRNDFSSQAKDFFKVEKSNEDEDKFTIKVLTSAKAAGLTSVKLEKRDKAKNLISSQDLLGNLRKCESSLWTIEKKNVDFSRIGFNTFESTVLNLLESVKSYVDKCKNQCEEPSGADLLLKTCIFHQWPCYGSKNFTGSIYSDHSFPECFCASGKIYYEYELTIPCMKEDNYSYELVSTAQITDDGTVIVDYINKTIYKGILCTKAVEEEQQQVQEEKKQTNKPSIVYPIYFDDECADDYKNIDGYEKKYIKNPFGRIKQQSQTKYENKNPREVHEGKLGIPKCSGWTLMEDMDGVKIYSVSPRTVCSGKWLPGMYQVTMYSGNKEPEVTLNNLSFLTKDNAYELIEYWDGKYKIVVPDYNSTNSYHLEDLDDFVDKLTKDNVLLYSFIAMLADWEYYFSHHSPVSNQIRPSLDVIAKGSDGFLYYFIRNAGVTSYSAKVSHSSSNLVLYKSHIREIVKLLPNSVKEKINSIVNLDPIDLKKRLINNCPLQCVFSDMFGKVATELSKINCNFVTDDDWGKSRNEGNYYINTKRELENYFSILCWEIFRRDNLYIYSLQNSPYKDQSESHFKSSLPSGNTTFYETFFKYVKENKCK